MQVITIEVASLGNRCHLVHDGRVGLVVDPPRDIATVERAAVEAGVEIAAVADTHLHNDYVSGALLLSRRHGADYLFSERERVGFERVGVRHGDHVPVGGRDVEVLATPGHTRHHQSFLARRPGTGEPGALFTGGSLLDGTVGRTDLVDAELTREQPAPSGPASAPSPLSTPAPTSTRPTASEPSRASRSATPTDGEITIAGQPTTNPVLATDLNDKERFVSDLISGCGRPRPTTPAWRRSTGEARAPRSPHVGPRRTTCPTLCWPAPG